MLSLTPFLLCLAIYVVFLVAVVLLADNVADLIIQPGAWWRSIIRLALMIALPLVFLIVAIFTYTVACFVVAAPFYEFLSAAVERKVAGTAEEEPFSVKSALVDIWRAVADSVVILVIELGVLILGLLIVPVTTVAALLASAVLLGLECVDYPMGRRRIPLKGRLGFARRHLWELLGLGLPILVGLAIPFIGVVFLPVGVVGGTLLFLELGGAGGQALD